MNAEWESIKSTLTYSHIRCMICRELLFYGNDTLITTGTRTIFACRCFNQISIQDKCADCGKQVKSQPLKEHAMRFRCTCGHSDLCLVRDIAETVKL
jgi:DNA-directed RNA polymerase subunit RPC12/RpoP